MFAVSQPAARRRQRDPRPADGAGRLTRARRAAGAGRGAPPRRARRRAPSPAGRDRAATVAATVDRVGRRARALRTPCDVQVVERAHGDPAQRRRSPQRRVAAQGHGARGHPARAAPPDRPGCAASRRGATSERGADRDAARRHRARGRGRRAAPRTSGATSPRGRPRRGSDGTTVTTRPRRPTRELHLAGGAGVQRVVLAHADAVAGLEAAAALADDDLAAGHGLAGEHLHAEALGVRVAAVAATSRGPSCVPLLGLLLLLRIAGPDDLGDLDAGQLLAVAGALAVAALGLELEDAQLRAAQMLDDLRVDLDLLPGRRRRRRRRRSGTGSARAATVAPSRRAGARRAGSGPSRRGTACRRSSRSRTWDVSVSDWWLLPPWQRNGAVRLCGRGAEASILAPSPAVRRRPSARRCAIVERTPTSGACRSGLLDPHEALLAHVRAAAGDRDDVAVDLRDRVVDVVHVRLDDRDEHLVARRGTARLARGPRRGRPP